MAWSNDLIALLLKLLAAYGLTLAYQPNREDMIAKLANAKLTHIFENSRLASLAERLLSVIKEDLRRSQCDLSEERASARQVANRHNALARRLPGDLARKMEVLLVPAREDSLRASSALLTSS